MVRRAKAPSPLRTPPNAPRIGRAGGGPIWCTSGCRFASGGGASGSALTLTAGGGAGRGRIAGTSSGLAGRSSLREEELMSRSTLLDAAGRRWSPATTPGYLSVRAPRNKGMRFGADSPRPEEIIRLMRQAGGDRHRLRVRAQNPRSAPRRPSGAGHTDSQTAVHLATTADCPSSGQRLRGVDCRCLLGRGSARRAPLAGV